MSNLTVNSSLIEISASTFSSYFLAIMDLFYRHKSVNKNRSTTDCMANIDFGLILRPTTQDLPVNTLLEYNWSSIQALSTGFTTLWVEDHLQWGEAPTLECLTTLSFLAGAFPNFRLGTVVLSQSFRNPALVA